MGSKDAGSVCVCDRESGTTSKIVNYIAQHQLNGPGRRPGGMGTLGSVRLKRGTYSAGRE